MFWKQPEKIVFIDVICGDRRSYAQKHIDSSYLDALESFGENSVWLTETQMALEKMRMVKDAAETPEEIKGINKCLRIMQELAFAPFRVAQERQLMREMEATED